eukprot:COSAG06_NODE_15191_length_1091_cov_1.187500_1_plen_80_part_10
MRCSQTVLGNCNLKKSPIEFFALPDADTNQIVVYAGHYLMFPSVRFLPRRANFVHDLTQLVCTSVQMYLHFPGPPAWNAS